MKSLLSRYHPLYLHSLLYMLQASDYRIRDYLRWYNRTIDFRNVARRRQLDWTPKAIVLAVILVLLALAGVAYVGLLFVLALTTGDAPAWARFAIWLIALPFAIAYAVTVPLLLGQALVQKPLEIWLTRKARQKLSAHRATKIAIAGSYGKTTFKEILAMVLSGGKRTQGQSLSVAATPGNKNTPLGISRFADTLTGKEDVLIFELGEYYPGDIAELCRLINPDIGVITGVNEAHLERFRKIERTIGTIFELAEYLKDKPVYVNGENEYAAQTADKRHILYNRHGAGPWKAGRPATGLAGTRFALIKGQVKLNVKTELLGLHQIGPLAAAAAIASQLGLKPKQIAAGLGKTKPFEARLQPVVQPNGVVYLNDGYNGSPDGAAAAIDFLAGLKRHRRMYVTPGLIEMGPRTEEVHQAIGQHLAKTADVVALVRNSVTPSIAAGLLKGGFTGELLWYDDALDCFAALPALTKPGDVVLLQNDWPDSYA